MSVKKLIINDENEGRRLDNFLLSLFKNVPKTKIYKIIRKGEVRVNSSRTKPHYKLRINDLVRIPPIIDLNKNIKKNIKNEDVDIHMSDILYEDQNFLIIGIGINIVKSPSISNYPTTNLYEITGKKFSYKLVANSLKSIFEKKLSKFF